jgi:predicted NBD/HSP70 family sugar kinase
MMLTVCKVEGEAMAERRQPRSRVATRAAILEGLLRGKRLLRHEIAAEAELTEASVSRIVSDLRSAGIVTEERLPTDHGGPRAASVALSKDVWVVGVELANDRLSVGLGDLEGRLDYVERQPVQRGLDQGGFERLCFAALADLARWAAERGRAVRQAAVALPGLTPVAGGAEINPILPWDMGRLRGFLARSLGEVPLAMTNSVIARAAFHRYRAEADYPAVGDHLFLFVGHGVAGVIVREGAPLDTFLPFELGHMVMRPGGAPCRCGHRGCLEAYTSLGAVSAVVDVTADDILKRGDQFLDTAALGPAQRDELRARLRLLGLGLGNALTLARLPAVVICGWPSLMPPADRAEIAAGLAESLLGGAGPGAPALHLIPPAIGNDPRPALAYAAHAFVRAGGQEFDVALPLPAAA